jgi:guanylate kinase
MSVGKLIIYSGPSGVGKGFVKNLFVHNPELKIRFSVSATTREPREGEVEGQHYHFVTHEKFDEMVANGEFLE